jgi:protein-S-isoprenylcysteine O-methyltransferase Ste14
MTPSPWWYRWRATLFGLIYGAGFFIGHLHISGGGGVPAAVVWGERWGDPGAYALLWLGVVFATLAWLARLSGTSYLRGDVVFAADVQRDRLIVDGAFRYVRNPLYLGNIFLALGIGLFASPLGFFIIVLGNLIYNPMLAREEERELGARYGADYAAYRAAVPAFVPRLTPASFPSMGRIEPDLRAGLIGETCSLAMALALVPIAAYGQNGLLPGAILFACGMILFVVLSRLARRTAKAA